MEASSSPSLIAQQLNSLTGEFQWVVVHDHHLDVPHSSPLAHTSYLDMLNDSERNAAYHAAIRKAVRGPCRILDIGAGTGLLSMMAARALQESIPPHSVCDGCVIACEAFLPMIRLARKILRLNGFSSFVHLLHKRSDEIKVGTEMSSCADLLVTEILDSTLLGEGLIPTLQQAHDVLLMPHARVIPHKATIYGQFVECDYFWRLHDLYGVETLVTDGLVLAPPCLKHRIFSSPPQYAMHVDALMDKLQKVSDPFKVFEFDFQNRLDSYRKTEVAVKATRTGVVHAIVSWWVLQLDEEGTVFYSTAPQWIDQKCGLWHDHWKQCVWFVAGQGLHVVRDEDINVRATHDEIGFQYHVGFEQDSIISSLVDLNHLGNMGWSMKPERIGLLGSQKWRATITTAIKKVLYAHPSSLCLVIDDSLPLTVSAAAASRDSLIVSLLPGLRLDGTEVLETILQANGLALDRVKFMGKKARDLNIADIGGRKVDVLLAEPYYHACENMLPWKNLRFWNERTCLAPILSEKVIIIPCKANLCGMALSMHDLWKSRQALASVEGFDHSSVNEELGACGNLPSPLEGPILPYPLWQCGDYQELTEPFSIMTFDFSKSIETVRSSTKVLISRSGVCHGIVLWIDWVMEMESNSTVSTGPEGHEPTFWKQGVKLLRSPVHVSRYKMEDESSYLEGLQDHFCKLLVSATFESENGELIVNADFF